MPNSKPMIRLIMGKFQVIRLDLGALGAKAVINLGNSVTATADIPASADLRLGDWLTFYTDVPYKGSLDAPSQPTPQQ